MRSLPQVTIRPLDGSMSMRLMLCLPSWKVANAVRLHREKRYNFLLKRRMTRGKKTTHSSSLMVSKQVSHMRTGNSKPMMGYGERLELHFPHTAFPHFLQWCCGNTGVA